MSTVPILDPLVLAAAPIAEQFVSHGCQLPDEGVIHSCCVFYIESSFSPSSECQNILNWCRLFFVGGGGLFFKSKSSLSQPRPSVLPLTLEGGC